MLTIDCQRDAVSNHLDAKLLSNTKVGLTEVIIWWYSQKCGWWPSLRTKWGPVLILKENKACWILAPSPSTVNKCDQLPHTSALWFPRNDGIHPQTGSSYIFSKQIKTYSVWPIERTVRCSGPSPPIHCAGPNRRFILTEGTGMRSLAVLVKCAPVHHWPSSQLQSAVDSSLACYQNHVTSL